MSAKEKGCYNCMKRRIKCDKERPQCAKCIKKGLHCPGYGIRYRFAPNAGSEKSKTSSHPSKAGTFAPPSLLWPDGSKTRQPGDKAVGTALSEPAVGLPDEFAVLDPFEISYILESDCMSSNLDTSVQQWDSIGDIELSDPDCQSRAGDPVHVSSDTLSWNETEGHSTSSLTIAPICGTLELLDWRTRDLFDHFSNKIAPVMVVVDSMFNGYRNLILPLAFEDSLVKAAVCVASLYHRGPEDPTSQHRAELGLQQILGKLRRRTLDSELVDIPAWTTLIILLTAETINGGLNLPRLFRLLQLLAAANEKNNKNSVMQTFLAEQTRMMTFLAQPSLDQQSGAMVLSHRSDDYLDFISNIATFQPALAREINIYKSAIHLASDIYVARATDDPPYSDTVADLDRLQVLCEEVHPNTPGHHTLVWVYFIAAAESSTLRHRDFFTMRLQEVFSQTKFNNIPAALGALQEIWKVQTQQKWTEILPEVMPFFII